MTDATQPFAEEGGLRRNHMTPMQQANRTLKMGNNLPHVETLLKLAQTCEELRRFVAERDQQQAAS